MKLLREHLKIERQRLADKPAELADVLGSVGQIMVDSGNAEPAVELLRESFEYFGLQRPKHWKHYETMSRLGAALAACSQSDEAEQLLLDGYDGMKRRAEDGSSSPIPQDFIEAAQRLVKFYTAAGDSKKASDWESRLKPELGSDHVE